MKTTEASALFNRVLHLNEEGFGPMRGAEERAVQAVLNAAYDTAAAACIDTCGEWSKDKKTEELFCPCARSILKLKELP